jgi:choline-phosphate cytidylyltransferase
MPPVGDNSQWLEFFLTPTEKDHFSNWREVVLDRSVVNPIFSPVFDWLSQFVPEQIAPNVLTLAGSFSILQAWYFCRTYAESDAQVVSAVSIVSIWAFWVLGGIDGKHARRTWNDTSVGELFKYACDVVTTLFLVIIMCEMLLEKSFDEQWYCVQTVELVFFMKHYSAFVREAGLRYFLIGPGELVSWAAGLLVISCFFGIGWIKVFYTYTWGACCGAFVTSFNLDPDGYFATMTPARAAYISAFIFAVLRIGGSRKLATRHAWTYWSLLCILGLRAASFMIRLFMSRSHSSITERDVIFDGLFMALITTDLIVAKMAGRELHAIVVIMASMVVLPHLQFLILCFVIFYYIAVFGDLMNHMNLPLLQQSRNVYCDGVYDLCHVGHKNLFRRALKLGNRLFVGVIGDEDANAYKRPPIMNAHERESEVASCKCVTKVIPNSPCFGLTEEFIRQHRIHVVAFGEEYAERFPNPDDDPYYKVPRKMGIGVPMPRTTDISTSELISRIQNRAPDEKKTPGK